MNQPRVEDDGDPTAMSIGAAQARILEAITPVTDLESVSTRDARGRVLAADLRSPIDVPRFRASAMDGYAFRHGDGGNARRLVGRSLAGHPGANTLSTGDCLRITTGARVPDDADTVVQQENVIVEGETLRVTTMPERGMNVRDVGSDSAYDALLIPGGTRLAAADLGVLAAHGIVTVEVIRKLRVALFSTGDELVEAGATPGEGQIHDANRALLHALLGDAAIEIDDLGICPDTPSALAKTLEAAREADALVSSGGVSVGEADHVRDVLGANGDVALWKIAMKPGRPLTFGSTGIGQIFFGLPGNPVSAALTALLFVRPALERMLGASAGTAHATVTAILDGSLHKRPGRVEFQRGVLSTVQGSLPRVATTGAQDSHILVSLQRANCLIELPIGSAGANDGEKVTVHPFTGFGHSPL